MAKSELIVARRNTATLMTKVIETPCGALMREEVPIGTRLCSFDATNPANESLMFSCDGNGTREPEQHCTEPFLLHNWCVQKIELQPEGADAPVPMLRTILLDPSGDVLAFVSAGVVQSLDLIRTLRGDGPYEPPIPLLVVPVKTRGGFKVWKLRPVHSGKAEIVKAPK